ncbi:Zinc finger transcription factor ace1 [Cytospora mali]|uniref:Zinc finger transcription factor ace1 n=1 Tax=Cytospora mali TaxID=578113 RepID=A0A194VGF6_CYTMA|nr:Zinc finger transcription factor ace1 [Valsa mali var. pyri (nom. inval.)]
MSNPRRTPATHPDGSLSLKTNMSLRKGHTFHSPTSPGSDNSTFRPPSLPRRSQTNLDDVIDAHRRRMRMTLDSIDQTLTASQSDTSPKTLVDKSFPFPEALHKHSVAMLDEPGKERRVLRPRSTLRRPARHHDSDSGLGTSVGTSQDKAGLDTTGKKGKTPSVKASTVTRSAAASTTTMPGLSSRATNKICEHVLKPLLAKPQLKTFHPLVIDCPRRIKEKEILCLRDLEKTLLLIAPESTKVVDLYLDFCLTTVRCIQATVEYLSDREQTRPRDVPYTNGYFIDLVEQIQLYAKQLADAKEKKPTGDMDVDASDEIKLHGGIHINGRPAELVRVKKDGKAVSLATGEEVEIEEEAKGALKFKRSASEEAADEDEIMRSMARRKKNASPEELAPKKCREPGCNKEFKRPCDLTKHEKTHSRPWKCPIETCKYHEYGWPTEKEMDRHCNDKHSIDPPMYRCMFSPCPYKSKRESNCKQHMEKAHGWEYVRTKTNGGGKKTASKAGSVVHKTPQIQGLPTPISNPSIGMATPPEERLPYQPNSIEFPTYMPDPDFDFNTMPQQIHLDPMEPMEYSEYSPVDNATPLTDSGLDSSSITFQDASTTDYQWDDIYSANQARVPAPTINKDFLQQFVAYTEAELMKSQPAHISPVGQGNAMLFTPHSLADVDEGFDDVPVDMTGSADFLLFPPETKQPLAYNQPPLFASEIPSVAAGYSQPNSQEFWEVDWSNANGYGYGSQH